ncbi:beta-ketoacyl-[acyl-carrier-protein] synthase family protein [Pseudomonas fluorescens]|uniref:Putative fatty acid biosynthesis-related protein n=1 Tax=Pseudomonas fluorescens (strain Pf0-1) TaxID=205922 RepID=Q3KJ87_PSEPF|nr:beta-ketoacyl-[acyl-carrier-protein] synthase family protein [Pseudomonas fluorescens]ABA72169.1 putative fatty acid biosynthesis-related protein [Pseudomonas fluorescens Pf0-1]MBY9023651.1 beta-ketoacyl-[acyl-carrier-protein] synthase family protein [Pseudomonas fluorescens]MBY9029643.1 beta-ketoacyl-[acyl-carrier-protein] synthase family protein [Pseudomonas fluorescens]MBY9035349.1 beta-ketoacyl-[acyl-carrier-protein] synthase family protein [Pseudomonas fluorescens]MBY9041830.1 beta-ket
MTAYLNALGVICALGRDKQTVARNLFAGDCSGMRRESGWVPERELPVAAVHGDLAPIPEALADQRSRNNQLLLEAALQIRDDIEQAIQTYGRDRIGVVLGTSTSGIDEASRGLAHYIRDQQFPADYDYRQQELGAPANFLADWLQLSGPTYVISTACTSSARALMSARRLLDLGLCDAVLCGGVDSLCKLTLNGFSALEAVSDERCNPFSANRNGINIGEAAVLFVMSKERGAGPGIALLGAGASSDAHHISAPEPTGRGALQAMQKALDQAHLQADDISYLNLHGTATQHNDAMESLAVDALFADGVPCSSTKPMTGHTLGAAGALEAAFCWLSLSADNPDHALPPHIWDGQADPDLPALKWVTASERLASIAPRYLMSNSFAFGGNNVSLIIGDAP